MTLNENYLAGTFSIIASFIILYFYTKKRKAEKNNKHIYMLAIGIGELIMGCCGICLNSLYSINMLLFGITMFSYMKKPHDPCGGVATIMHYKGWLAAILAIIAGILKILIDLHILK